MTRFTKGIFVCCFLALCACVFAETPPMNATGLIPPRDGQAISGSVFIEKALKVNPETREILIADEILQGNFPDFMRQLARIDVETTSPDGKVIKAFYYVMPDYLMIGSDEDFVRMPMQPKTAQKIADTFGFFLSTRKICNDVYKAAVVKLEPRPLTVDRDSLYTFVEHDKIIEEQRQGAKGLIAGIKKDVIITSAISNDPRPNRLALYGWHKLDGIPIQNIYTGHIDWYVDYSHGFRLVARTIFVDGKPMDYIDVLKDPVLSRLICDEEQCDFYAYPYGK